MHFSQITFVGVNVLIFNLTVNGYPESFISVVCLNDHMTQINQKGKQDLYICSNNGKVHYLKTNCKEKKHLHWE